MSSANAAIFNFVCLLTLHAVKFVCLVGASVPVASAHCSYVDIDVDLKISFPDSMTVSDREYALEEITFSNVLLN